MADVTKSCTVGSNDASVGDMQWVAVEDIYTSNDVYANTEYALSENTSNYLKAQHFDFAIPTGATIDGIEVIIEKHADVEGLIYDNAVYIIKADGSLGSENKYNYDPWAVDDYELVYGGSTDLWSETWSAENINDDDFGVAIQAKNDSKDEAYPLVDHIFITVYYTEAVSGVSLQTRTVWFM